MKLSILIPTFDYVCYTLVHDVHTQCEAMGDFGGYEIIVLEDGGKDRGKAIANHKINELSHCKYIRNEKNVGRAAIRNRLADMARGEWLIFMDSDGKVISSDFIRKYMENAQNPTNIICGGLTHTKVCPTPSCSLRWKYEHYYEVSQKKNKTFRSFCFMIYQSTFQQVRFNESYSGYGMEDMQFGIDIQTKGFNFKHIDNPLLNNDLETNSRFLKKTEESLHTLYTHQEHLEASHLLTFIHQHPISTRITPLVYKISRYFLLKNLLGKSPNITLFNFYKLGYYLTINNE